MNKNHKNFNKVYYIFRSSLILNLKKSNNDKHNTKPQPVCCLVGPLTHTTDRCR